MHFWCILPLRVTDFSKLLKKHIEEEEYQQYASSLNLNKYNKNLVIEIAKHSDNKEILNNLLKYTFVTESQAEELKEIMPSSVLIAALRRGTLTNAAAKIFFEKVKAEVKDSKIISSEVFYFYEDLIYSFYASKDEYIKDMLLTNPNHFKYNPIAASKELQEELLREFETRAENKEFEDIYEKFYYIENIGEYLAKSGNIDIVKRLVKINDKMFEKLNLIVLERDDIVITKEEVKDFLTNGTQHLRKIILIDGLELTFTYNQNSILDVLIEKADETAKEYLLNSILNREDISFRDNYILKLTNSYEGIKKLYNKIDTIATDEEEANKLKYNLFFKNLGNSISLPKEEIEKIEKDYFFNNSHPTHTIYNGKTILLKQDNIPAEYLRGLGSQTVTLYRKKKLNKEEIEILVDDYDNYNIYQKDRNCRNLLVYANSILNPDELSDELKEKLILISIKEKLMETIPFFL